VTERLNGLLIKLTKSRPRP